MKKTEFQKIEKFMLECMKDCAHDSEHIYRVLYTALHIAETEFKVNTDILIAACLLHDIGREAQFKDPGICHAAEGGEMAREFLAELGWLKEDSEHVKHCISTHRFRSKNPPKTIEAKILFDSDKLEVTGALGIVRTLIYKGQVGEPIYAMANGCIDPGTDSESPESFYKEYHFKLEKLYSRFYTKEAQNIANKRKGISQLFFNSLADEINTEYEFKNHLQKILED